MPNLILSFLLLLLCCSCNKSADADTADVQSAELSVVQEPAPDLPRKRLLVAFSGTETDQWTTAIAGSLGTELHFDPWSKPGADDFFDYFGDYDLRLDNLPLDLKIVLTGMDSTSGLDRQQAAAGHLLEIAEEWQPDLIWLDGDQLQYAAGRLLLDKGYQIAFSGLQYDSAMYYEAEDKAAGFYRRHSVSGTMGRIWRDNKEALFHCIITDDSSEGRRRLKAFVDAEDLLGEGSTLHVLSPFSSWEELRQSISEIPAEVDDLIICAAAEQGASEVLQSTPPPLDILASCEVPVYVLGPSVLDLFGISSLSVKPAAQVHEMMTAVYANLGREIPMSSIPSIVPEDMQTSVSEIDTPASAD